MSKLIAPAALRDHHARLTEDGRLGEGMLIEIGYQIAAIKKKRRPLVFTDPPKPPKNRPPHWAETAAIVHSLEAEANDFTREETLRQRVADGLEMLLDNRDRQALTQSRLRPLRKDERRHADGPGRPTDELVARAGGEEAFDISVAGKGERAPVKRYVRRNPWQGFRDLVQPDVCEAFDRFTEDAELAGAIRVTANYDGVGGGAFGPRAGGLGDVEQEDHDAFNRHQDRMRMLHEIMDTPHSRVRATTILAWVILREKLDEGKCLSLVDLGRRLCPERSQEDYLRGIAFEAIEMVGRVLVNINHHLERRQLSVNGGKGLLDKSAVAKAIKNMKADRRR